MINAAEIQVKQVYLFIKLLFGFQFLSSVVQLVSYRDASCMHKTMLTLEVGICSSGAWFYVTGHLVHDILNHRVSAVLWIRYLSCWGMMLFLWVWFLTFWDNYYFLNCQKPNIHDAASYPRRIGTSSTPLQKLKNSYC